VKIEHTALTLQELIEANPGADVLITEKQDSPTSPTTRPYSASIVSVPTQSAAELESTSPPNTGEKLPVKSGLVLLKTDAGTKVVPLDRIADITFKADHQPKASQDEFRNLLTLKLHWPDNQPQKEADVGLLYVQKGVRWIPNYKVTIDGKGSATVQLQATLINELADLNDITAHLVIGVPSFQFKDTIDPISLQQAVAQLSGYFNASDSNLISNGSLAQVASNLRGGSESRSQPGAVAPPINLGPEVASSGKTEDLFVFTVNHVTLKKGERMVMPVKEFQLKYKDVYKLDLPFAPPAELARNMNSEQQAEIARLLAAPKVMHKIRLSNTSDSPLTTSPALILTGDKILAQGMMTYAAPAPIAISTSPLPSMSA